MITLIASGIILFVLAVFFIKVLLWIALGFLTYYAIKLIVDDLIAYYK